jgi:hypothetical protein
MAEKLPLTASEIAKPIVRRRDSNKAVTMKSCPCLSELNCPVDGAIARNLACAPNYLRAAHKRSTAPSFLISIPPFIS